MLAWTLYRAGEENAATVAAATTMQLDPVHAETPWIALLVALRTGRAADAEVLLARLRRALGHVGEAFDSDWRAELQAELPQLALPDAGLQALRGEALALVGAA